MTEMRLFDVSGLVYTDAYVWILLHHVVWKLHLYLNFYLHFHHDILNEACTQTIAEALTHPSGFCSTNFLESITNFLEYIEVFNNFATEKKAYILIKFKI